ncbi:hypothetical protein ES703_32024 [subsurface metagenome]
MQEVVLIIPPWPFLLEQKRNCPLGILYIAAVLEKGGYKVQVKDLRDCPKDEWQSIPLAEVYGITSTTIDFPYAVEVAEFLKERDNCRIIIGGPATLEPDACLEHGFSVVKGEGEEVIIPMIEQHIRITEGHVENLDSLPLPARHLLPRETIVSTTLCHEGVPATTISSSRGCPFNCTFCASPKIWGRRVRRHSPEQVMEEVESLVRVYGVKELKFQDDELNLDREWLKQLAPLSDLVKFRGYARAEAGNWRYLKEAGCYEAAIGIETANPEAHFLHKGVTLEKTVEELWEAYEAGLQLRICFIIGLPYDTGDISGRTIGFLKEIPPAKVVLSVLSPCPGSAIGDNPKRFGLEHLGRAGTMAAQDEKPVFTFRLDSMTTDELTYHYNKLRAYLSEEGLLRR